MSFIVKVTPKVYYKAEARPLWWELLKFDTGKDIRTALLWAHHQLKTCSCPQISPHRLCKCRRWWGLGGAPQSDAVGGNKYAWKVWIYLKRQTAQEAILLRKVHIFKKSLQDKPITICCEVWNHTEMKMC